MKQRNAHVKLTASFAISWFLAFGLLVGCTEATECQLFNNSHYTVQVIRQHGSAIERLELLPAGAVSLESWTSSNFFIVRGDEAWMFTPTFPPESSVKREGVGPWSKRRVHVQLEADGNLYLLPSAAQPPVAGILNQPTGFPLIGSMVELSSVPK